MNGGRSARFHPGPVMAPRRLAHGYGSYLLALLATLIWSGNLIAARGLKDNVPPVSLAFWRCLVATLVMAPWGLGRISAEFQLVRSHLKLLAFLGLSGIAVFTIMVYIAAHTTAATNMSLLAVTAPAFILLLARALHGQRLGWCRSAGTVLALAGVAALVTRGTLSAVQPRPGDLWILGATLIFAYYSLLVRRAPPAMSSATVLLTTFLIALVLLLPCYLLELALVGGFKVTVPVLASICYVGALSSAAAYSCWNRAVEGVGATRAGLLYYFLPVFTALLSAWILGEPIAPEQALSAALIIAGVALGLRRSPRRSGSNVHPPH